VSTPGAVAVPPGSHQQQHLRTPTTATPKRLWAQSATARRNDPWPSNGGQRWPPLLGEGGAIAADRCRGQQIVSRGEDRAGRAVGSPCRQPRPLPSSPCARRAGRHHLPSWLERRDPWQRHELRRPENWAISAPTLRPIMAGRHRWARGRPALGFEQGTPCRASSFRPGKNRPDALNLVVSRLLGGRPTSILPTRADPHRASPLSIPIRAIQRRGHTRSPESQKKKNHQERAWPPARPSETESEDATAHG